MYDEGRWAFGDHGASSPLLDDPAVVDGKVREAARTAQEHSISMHDPFVLQLLLPQLDHASSLLHWSNKLFVGRTDGSLQRYSLSHNRSTGTDAAPAAELESTTASLAKRPAGAALAPIEAMCLIKETNSLVGLSGGEVTLYDASTLEVQTSCERWTKGQAGSMWIDTSVFRQGRSADRTAPSRLSTLDRTREASGIDRSRRTSVMTDTASIASATASPRLSKLGKASKAPSVVEVSSPQDVEAGVPVLVTTLAVPCRRRLVLFSWRDGEWMEPREVALPHQARSLCFPTPLKIFIGYSTGDYATVALPSPIGGGDATAPSLSESFVPPVIAAIGTAAASTAPTAADTSSLTGSFGLSSLAAKTGSLVSLGLTSGKVSRNTVLKVGNPNAEVLAVKDGLATFMTADGRLSRPTAGAGIVYASAPDETAVVGPYVVSVLNVPTGASLQVNSVPSLSTVQTVRLPARAESKPGSSSKTASAPKAPPSVPTPARLLSPSVGGKAPILLASSAGDDGATTGLYMLSMKSWPEQVDELTANGEYEEAQALLADVDLISLPDKAERMARLNALAAVRSFMAGDYDSAIDAFVTLDVNPAKVVALYPHRISGKFERPREGWEELFGGRSRQAYLAEANGPPAEEGSVEDGASGKERSASPAKTSEADSASVRSLKSQPSRRTLRGKASLRSLNKPGEDLRQSVDVLVRYLTDRRQNVNRALSRASVPADELRASVTPRSVDDLFALPDAPISQLDDVEVALVAQIVDTALFKCYLATKPSMLGPLCRLENWCQVDEVETLLMEAKRYQELLDLYHGKAKHDRALRLLKTMSEEGEDDDDDDERLQPTVRYLQKLGPDHLELIFETSKWVLAANRTAALEIFTADLRAVERLPRHAVAEHLEKVDPVACIAYLEHLIGSLDERGPDLHDKLVRLYIAQHQREEAEGDEDAAQATYGKLLAFLRSSEQYSPDSVIGRLPQDSMLEARALALGRMGRHEAALTIYVQRLDDPATAEEYCKSVYNQSPDSKGAIFLALLRILLRPSTDGAARKPRFEAALKLIADNGSRIDAAEALDLLPPLVKMADIGVFLTKSLRTTRQARREARVTRELYRARLDQLERGVMGYEERRVKIDESRVCAACGKRFGNSVIAVHSPYGEVTHYQCRERLLPKYAK